MRPTTIHLKIIGCCMLVLLIIATGIIPTRANAASNTGDSQDRYVTIDFNNVDINVFIKFISELTGKNFIVDQRVRGNVTIISPTKISVAEAYKVFESVLEVNGFSTVQAGKATKILPSPEARTSDIPTRTSTKPVTPQDQLVTQLIPLTYANADEIKRLFTPMVSKTSLIVAYAPTNTLIVTDVLSNIQRLIKILKEIDVADVGRQISVIPLQHADSTKMVETLTALFLTRGATKQRTTASRDDTKFVADERTNTVIVLASEVEMARVRQLIDFIDRETPRGKEKIRVYYLEYANAEDIAKVLQNLPSKEGTSVKEKAAAGAAGAPLLSGKVNITADKATNSLVITASSDDYTVVEEVIKRLDIPRPMVYIEAVVMEVNAQRDFSLGTEWTAAGTTNIGNKPAAVGGGFLTPTSAIPALTQGVLPQGFSFGVFTEAIDIAGIKFNNLTALVQAFKQDRDVNILQTPQILTTENEEAKINVGRNIPFQTQSSTTDNQTFNSFEYRDVGTILKITPHISIERLVRLTIGLEVSALESTTDFRPTTLKRTIDTTVIVDDKSTIVIGGLIEDTNAVSVYKVPLLGDIPVLGWLFKVQKSSQQKTNLYIFLTPHVINNPSEAADVYGQKKTTMDSLRGGQGEESQIQEGNIKLFGIPRRMPTSGIK
ncbi:MAG: type II secretion system secretin GspD [Desulfobacterales bacterium]|nr:type II secretion system secretin GspD [Desulfobacterales bacterium]